MLTEKIICDLPVAKRVYWRYDCDGLYLKVSASGVKTFHHRISSAAAPEKLGTWPDMSLQEARAVASLYRAEKKKPAAVTFAAVAKRYLDERLKPYATARHAASVAWRLERYIFPVLGHKRTDGITPADVAQIVNNACARGAYELARRLLGITGAVFRYSMILGLSENNPCAAFRSMLPPARVKHYAALISPTDIGLFLRRLHTRPVSLSFMWLELQTLLFLRPSELRKAYCGQVDLKNKILTIPAEQTKKRRELLVPLCPRAVELMEQLLNLAGGFGLLFPGNNPGSPLTDTGLFKAACSLGYKRGDLTLHGFRATASTNLNEAGVRSDYIETQLGHVELNAARAPYNRARYLNQRTVMMDYWAQWLRCAELKLPLPEPPDLIR